MVGQKTAEHVAAVRGTTLEVAATWLADGSRAYGVLVRLEASRRLYWLPGVSVFSLLLTRGPDRPPMIGGPLGTLRPRPEIRIQPQARARAAATPRARHDGGSKPAVTTGSGSVSLVRPARRILVSGA